MYLNAGGVTVSYFEWLKKPFPYKILVEWKKRYNQNKSMDIINTVEKMTGKSLTSREKAQIARGADEVDLARSGLEETMVSSFYQIHDVFKRRKGITDYRTAAFVTALNKVANDYMTLGVFP